MAPNLQLDERERRVQDPLRRPLPPLTTPNPPTQKKRHPHLSGHDRPEFLQTFRGGERGVTARAVIAVTGGDPARATRLGAQELERRVRAAAPGRHIGHNKIKQLIEKTSRPVGYRAARGAYAARLQRLMRRRALVEGQLEALKEELLHLYPDFPERNA